MKEDGRLLASVSSAFWECSVQVFTGIATESLFGFHVHRFISVFPEKVAFHAFHRL
jgi:hypothetical protein